MVLLDENNRSLKELLMMGCMKQMKIDLCIGINSSTQI